MNDDHLMSTDALISFVKEMNKELVYHKKEKIPMGYWTQDQVDENCCKELMKRIPTVRHDRKQLIHCANYLFFMWCKLNGETTK